jgi:hypothetical protein
MGGDNAANCRGINSDRVYWTYPDAPYTGGLEDWSSTHYAHSFWDERFQYVDYFENPAGAGPMHNRTPDNNGSTPQDLIEEGHLGVNDFYRRHWVCVGSSGQPEGQYQIHPIFEKNLWTTKPEDIDPAYQFQYIFSSRWLNYEGTDSHGFMTNGLGYINSSSRVPLPLNVSLGCLDTDRRTFKADAVFGSNWNTLSSNEEQSFNLDWMIHNASDGRDIGHSFPSRGQNHLYESMKSLAVPDHDFYPDSTQYAFSTIPPCKGSVDSDLNMTRSPLGYSYKIERVTDRWTVKLKGWDLAPHPLGYLDKSVEIDWTILKVDGSLIKDNLETVLPLKFKALSMGRSLSAPIEIEVVGVEIINKTKRGEVFVTYGNGDKSVALSLKDAITFDQTGDEAPFENETFQRSVDPETISQLYEEAVSNGSMYPLYVGYPYQQWRWLNHPFWNGQENTPYSVYGKINSVHRNVPDSVVTGDGITLPDYQGFPVNLGTPRMFTDKQYVEGNVRVDPRVKFPQTFDFSNGEEEDNKRILRYSVLEEDQEELEFTIRYTLKVSVGQNSTHWILDYNDTIGPSDIKVRNVDEDPIVPVKMQGSTLIAPPDRPQEIRPPETFVDHDEKVVTLYPHFSDFFIDPQRPTTVSNSVASDYFVNRLGSWFAPDKEDYARVLMLNHTGDPVVKISGLSCSQSSLKVLDTQTSQQILPAFSRNFYVSPYITEAESSAWKTGGYVRNFTNVQTIPQAPEGESFTGNTLLPYGDFYSSPYEYNASHFDSGQPTYRPAFACPNFIPSTTDYSSFGGPDETNISHYFDPKTTPLNRPGVFALPSEVYGFNSQLALHNSSMKSASWARSYRDQDEIEGLAFGSQWKEFYSLYDGGTVHAKIEGYSNLCGHNIDQAPESTLPSTLVADPCHVYNDVETGDSGTTFHNPSSVTLKRSNSSLVVVDNNFLHNTIQHPLDFPPFITDALSFLEGYWSSTYTSGSNRIHRLTNVDYTSASARVAAQCLHGWTTQHSPSFNYKHDYRAARYNYLAFSLCLSRPLIRNTDGNVIRYGAVGGGRNVHELSSDNADSDIIYENGFNDYCFSLRPLSEFSKDGIMPHMHAPGTSMTMSTGSSNTPGVSENSPQTYALLSDAGFDPVTDDGYSFVSTANGYLFSGAAYPPWFGTSANGSYFKPSQVARLEAGDTNVRYEASVGYGEVLTDTPYPGVQAPPYGPSDVALSFPTYEGLDPNPVNWLTKTHKLESLTVNFGNASVTDPDGTVWEGGYTTYYDVELVEVVVPEGHHGSGSAYGVNYGPSPEYTTRSHIQTVYYGAFEPFGFSTPEAVDADISAVGDFILMNQGSRDSKVSVVNTCGDRPWRTWNAPNFGPISRATYGSDVFLIESTRAQIEVPNSRHALGVGYERSDVVPGVSTGWEITSMTKGGVGGDYGIFPVAAYNDLCPSKFNALRHYYGRAWNTNSILWQGTISGSSGLQLFDNEQLSEQKLSPRVFRHRNGYSQEGNYETFDHNQSFSEIPFKVMTFDDSIPETYEEFYTEEERADVNKNLAANAFWNQSGWKYGYTAGVGHTLLKVNFTAVSESYYFQYYNIVGPPAVSPGWKYSSRNQIDSLYPSGTIASGEVGPQTISFSATASSSSVPKPNYSCSDIGISSNQTLECGSVNKIPAFLGSITDRRIKNIGRFTQEFELPPGRNTHNVTVPNPYFNSSGNKATVSTGFLEVFTVLPGHTTESMKQLIKDAQNNHPCAPTQITNLPRLPIANHGVLFFSYINQDRSIDLRSNYNIWRDKGLTDQMQAGMFSRIGDQQNHSWTEPNSLYYEGFMESFTRANCDTVGQGEGWKKYRELIIQGSNKYCKYPQIMDTNITGNRFFPKVSRLWSQAIVPSGGTPSTTKVCYGILGSNRNMAVYSVNSPSGDINGTASIDLCRTYKNNKANNYLLKDTSIISGLWGGSDWFEAYYQTYENRDYGTIERYYPDSPPVVFQKHAHASNMRYHRIPSVGSHMEAFWSTYYGLSDVSLAPAPYWSYGGTISDRRKFKDAGMFKSSMQTLGMISYGIAKLFNLFAPQTVSYTTQRGNQPAHIYSGTYGIKGNLFLTGSPNQEVTIVLIPAQWVANQRRDDEYFSNRLPLAVNGTGWFSWSDDRYDRTLHGVRMNSGTRNWQDWDTIYQQSAKVLQAGTYTLNTLGEANCLIDLERSEELEIPSGCYVPFALSGKKLLPSIVTDFFGNRQNAPQTSDYPGIPEALQPNPAYIDDGRICDSNNWISNYRLIPLNVQRGQKIPGELDASKIGPVFLTREPELIPSFDTSKDDVQKIEKEFNASFNAPYGVVIRREFDPVEGEIDKYLSTGVGSFKVLAYPKHVDGWTRYFNVSPLQNSLGYIPKFYSYLQTFGRWNWLHGDERTEDTEDENEFNDVLYEKWNEQDGTLCIEIASFKKEEQEEDATEPPSYVKDLTWFISNKSQVEHCTFPASPPFSIPFGSATVGYHESRQHLDGQLTELGIVPPPFGSDYHHDGNHIWEHAEEPRLGLLNFAMDNDPDEIFETTRQSRGVLVAQIGMFNTTGYVGSKTEQILQHEGVKEKNPRIYQGIADASYNSDFEYLSQSGDPVQGETLRLKIRANDLHGATSDWVTLGDVKLDKEIPHINEIFINGSLQPSTVEINNGQEHVVVKEQAPVDRLKFIEMYPHAASSVDIEKEISKVMLFNRIDLQLPLKLYGYTKPDTEIYTGRARRITGEECGEKLCTSVGSTDFATGSTGSGYFEYKPEGSHNTEKDWLTITNPPDPEVEGSVETIELNIPSNGTYKSYSFVSVSFAGAFTEKTITLLHKDPKWVSGTIEGDMAVIQVRDCQLGSDVTFDLFDLTAGNGTDPDYTKTVKGVGVGNTTGAISVVCSKVLTSVSATMTATFSREADPNAEDPADDPGTYFSISNVLPLGLNPSVGDRVHGTGIVDENGNDAYVTIASKDEESGLYILSLPLPSTASVQVVPLVATKVNATGKTPDGCPFILGQVVEGLGYSEEVTVLAIDEDYPNVITLSMPLPNSGQPNSYFVTLKRQYSVTVYVKIAGTQVWTVSKGSDDVQVL